MQEAHQVYYTSDAMAAAGAPPGRYRLGDLELEAGRDRAVRQPGSGLLAGSALPPLAGVIEAASMLGRRSPPGPSWLQAWESFSLSPARFMGVGLEPREGRPARFALAWEEEGLSEVAVHLPLGTGTEKLVHGSDNA